MLTIFTTCRDCIKYPAYHTCQYNSIRSWSLLKPTPEILVIGDDNGVRELCNELQVKHIPEVDLLYGVPVLPSLFDQAEKHASNNTLLLASSDIILFQSTIQAAKSLNENLPQFCGVTRKAEAKIQNKLDFSKDLISQIDITFWWQFGAGDYFMFNKGFFENMPPMIIGRSRCDNYLFWYGNHKRCLINLTEAVLIIHHEHDKPDVGGREVENDHETYAYNRKIVGDRRSDISKSNFTMRKDFSID